MCRIICRACVFQLSFRYLASVSCFLSVSDEKFIDLSGREEREEGGKQEIFLHLSRNWEFLSFSVEPDGLILGA